MNCKRCQKLLHEYLDQDLHLRVRRSFETHLQRCESCREALDRENSAAVSLSRLLSQFPDSIQLRPGTHQRVLERLETGAPSPPLRKSYLRVLWRPALVTTAVVALLIVALLLNPNPPRKPLPPRTPSPVSHHPASYVMCMATTFADEARLDWVKRRLIVEIRNGTSGYLDIVARKPPKQSTPNE